MGITYKMGEKLARNENAFDKNKVEIVNPYALQTIETLRKVQCFALKKLAIEFCEKWNVCYTSVIQVKTRFQKTWIVNLGRNEFMPDHAEAHLIAQAFGRKITSIE